MNIEKIIAIDIFIAQDQSISGNSALHRNTRPCQQETEKRNTLFFKCWSQIHNDANVPACLLAILISGQMTWHIF